MKLTKFTQALLLIAFSAPLYAGSEDKSTVLLNSSKATIDKQDFDAYVQRVPQQDRVEFLLDQNRINGVVQILYVNRALAKEAKQLNLDKDPLVSKQIELYADQILTKLRIEKLKKDTKLPDFEKRAQELYKINIDQYKVPDQAHAMHILVGTTKRSKDEAQKLAQEVRAKAVMNEKSFEDLAMEYSDDPSVKNNKGDLGFFAANRMVKPFSDATFAMKEAGTISEPVETQFGFHIIKLIEKKDGYTKPFETVKAGIIQRLQDEYLDEVVHDYQNSIKSDKEIVTNTEAIAKLRPIILKAAETPKKEDVNQ